MPTAISDGITTRYEIKGSGPPLLLFSPGGFNARLENWWELGSYQDLGLVEHLAESFTCVLFDRRESGGSGGRVERIGWENYVAQALGVLDHLGIEDAHMMGGCVGCSTAAAIAVSAPERVRSMVLYSPAGGPRYRMTQHDRFAQHLAFVMEHGLEAVVNLAGEHDHGFSQDPRVGPWASVLRADASFAAHYRSVPVTDYLTAVTGTARLLFDRDTVPGAEPEDLMRSSVPALIVPGEDRSHAPSAAHYLHECLPHVEFWDVPVDQRDASNAPRRVEQFLLKAGLD